MPELPKGKHPFFLLPERSVTMNAVTGSNSQIVLRYREVGSGNPILFLHDFSNSAYTFRHLIHPLSSRYRLFLPELLDPTGSQTLPDMNYRPERLAEFVLQICQALEISRPLLVAQREVGLAAILTALFSPEKIRAVVAMSVPITLSRGSRLKGFFLRPKLISQLWAKQRFKRPQMAAMAFLQYEDPQCYCRQEIRQLSYPWSNWPSAKARAQIFSQSLHPGYREEFFQKIMEQVSPNRPFPIPLKLVYGKSDRRTPAEQGENLNRLLPGSELVVAEHCAGSMHVEDPEWTAKIITTTMKD